MLFFFKRLRKHCQGTIILEFAFLAPLFFLLLLGVMEFSFILLRMVIAENALRQAARQSIISSNDQQTIATRVQQQSQGLINFSDPAATCVCITAYSSIAKLNTARSATVSSCGACRSGDAQPTAPNAVVHYELIYRHNYITPIGSLIKLITGNNNGPGNFMSLRTSTVVTNEPFSAPPPTP
jgi:Flp pilus assembly protein TadG